MILTYLQESDFKTDMIVRPFGSQSEIPYGASEIWDRGPYRPHMQKPFSAFPAFYAINESVRENVWKKFFFAKMTSPDGSHMGPMWVAHMGFPILPRWAPSMFLTGLHLKPPSNCLTEGESAYSNQPREKSFLWSYCSWKQHIYIFGKKQPNFHEKMVRGLIFQNCVRSPMKPPMTIYLISLLWRL
jgi:hypothetical protein